MPRLVRPAATLVIGGLLLSACGGNVTDAGADQEQPTELRLAIGGEPDEGFDPTLGWGRYGSPLFHSTLLRRNADLEIENDLATGYEVSDDGLTWTVDLRTDATFTDGEPVTSADVAYTFNTAATQGGLTDVTALDRAEAIDEDTVELRLDEPRSTFINRLVSLGIVPEHAHDQGYAQAPVGSGPFELVSWQKGQQLVVQRNDDYYGTAPEFERLVFLFTDEDATLAAARTGDVDLASVPSSMATQELAGMELHAVESIDNRGIVLPSVPDRGRSTDEGQPIGNDVTADLAIRQALSESIDREALVDGVLEGFGAPATGPVDGTPWFEPEAALTEFGADVATETLEEGGWTDEDGDGVREKGGTKAAFTLLYPADDTIRQGLALNVADMAGEVGIDVTAEGVSWEEIDQRLHSDAVLFGWGSHDPTEMYNLYHSGLAGTDYHNPGFYENRTVDAHLDAAMQATDEDEANAEWRAAQLDADGEGFAHEHPWVWLVNLDHTYYADECLDLGALQTEPHGHGWPITAGITEWSWRCDS